MLHVSNNCKSYCRVILDLVLVVSKRVSFECTKLNSHDCWTPPSNWRGPSCIIWKVYNKVFKHEVWCISLRSVPLTGGVQLPKALLLPKLWSSARTEHPWTTAVAPWDKSLNASVELTGGWLYWNQNYSNIGDKNIIMNSRLILINCATFLKLNTTSCYKL